MSTTMRAAFARALPADEDDLGPNGNVDRDDGQDWRDPTTVAPSPRRGRSPYVRGFDAATLTTVAECEAALVEVGAEADEVRRQIAAANEAPEATDHDWLIRAKGALRGKFAIRDAVRARLRTLRGDPPAGPRPAAVPDLPESAFPVDYDVADLPTSAACADAGAALLAEMAALRDLLAGGAGPRDWRLRAEREIRRLAALRQRAQDRRGALRREEARTSFGATKAALDFEWRKRFVRAAKAELPPETYVALCRAADAPEDAA